MISLATFAHLGKAAFVGVIFVVVGDEFQIPPIGENLERWKLLPESDFMHDLCNGLCVKLKKFRRRQLVGPVGGGVYEPGDWEHFKNVGSLYQMEVGPAMQLARQWYPITGEEVRTTLCVTNRRRKAVNDAENKRLAFQQPAIWCPYGGADQRAQSFFCWPGMELQAGKTEGEIKNGIRFTVDRKRRKHTNFFTQTFVSPHPRMCAQLQANRRGTNMGGGRCSESTPPLIKTLLDALTRMQTAVDR